MLAPLTYLLMFLLSLGQLARISFLNQEVNVYLFEFVLFLMWIILLVKTKSIQKIKKNITHDRFLQSSFLVLVILGLSFIINAPLFSLQQNSIGALYLGRLLFYILFAITLFYSESLPFFKNAILCFIVSLIVSSWLQYFLYPDLRNLAYLGWDPHHFRIFGFFFDTSITGMLFVLSFFWIYFRDFKNHILKYILMASLLIQLFLTYSRISYGVFLLIALVIIVRKYTLKWAILVACSFIALLFFLPRPQGESVNLTRLFTIQARVQDDKGALNLFIKRPILGYGYGLVRFVRPDQNSLHSSQAFSSSFLTVLVSSGIIGFIAFCIWLYFLFLKLNYKGRLLLMGVLFGSLFDNIFLVNFIFLAFVLMTKEFFSSQLNKKQSNLSQ